MWLSGLILLTILTISTKCSDVELSAVEAAFQGQCGHNTPCDQLCYELHDGMYECDCTEGYELNKNGYSCQEINSTLQPNGELVPKAEGEDVLYQKGASFSAKLDNDINSNGSGDDGDDDANNNSDDEGGDDASDGSRSSGSLGNRRKNNPSNHHVAKMRIHTPITIIKSNRLSKSNNKNNKETPEASDSYDGGEVEFYAYNSVPDDDDGDNDDDEDNGEETIKGKNLSLYSKYLSSSTLPGQVVGSSSIQQKSLQQTESVININPYNSIDEAEASNKVQDMSIYDDVNNNRLNLRNFDLTSIYRNTDLGDRTATATLTTKTVEKIPTPLAKLPMNSTSRLPDIVIMSAVGSSSNATAAIGPCSLDCGTDGSCDFNPSGTNVKTSMRCLCPFGKTGNGCRDDVKTNLPRFSKNSWLAFPALRGAYKHVQLHVEFRPESYDGIILLTGERDDLTGDFMALLIHHGFIEFWFDCGSGAGNVRSKESVLLNQWNSVTVYRHRWDAWLVLNHGTRVQGRSKGLFSRITFREPVFLGGVGNITGLAKRLPINVGMVGCVRRFIANEHEYKFISAPFGDVTEGFDIQDCLIDKCTKYPCQHGGKCLPSSHQGAVCVCPLGFAGDLCETKLNLEVPSFNGSSYLRYAPIGDSAIIWLELRVIIKPYQEDGLILYSGHEEYGDFIALSLNMGFVEFAFDLGSGPAIVRSEFPLTLEQWHVVKISRTARLAVLKIDQLLEVMTISSNGFWHLSLPHSLFLGGINNAKNLPSGLKERGSYIGCIQKVEINGRSLSIISDALGGTNVDNCPHACNTHPCGPLAQCLPLLDNYECRCNPFTAQCNQAEEVPLKQQSQHRNKVSTTSVEAMSRHRMRATTASTMVPTIKSNKTHRKNNQHQYQIKTKLSREQGHSNDETKYHMYDDEDYYNSEDYARETVSASKPGTKSHSTKLHKKFSPDDNKTSSSVIAEPKNVLGRHMTADSVSNAKDEAENVIEDLKMYSIFEKGSHQPSSERNGLQKKNSEKDFINFKYDGRSEEATGHYHHPPSHHVRTMPQKNVKQNIHHRKHKNNDRIQDMKSMTAAKQTEITFERPLVNDDDKTEDKNTSQIEMDEDLDIKDNGHIGISPPTSSSSDIINFQTVPDDGIFIGEDDFQTRLLIQDMERIMKNSKELRAQEESEQEMEEQQRRNGHNDHDNIKKQNAYDNSGRVGATSAFRRSRGACFTGMDSYFHYNDAETMSQIISYKIDLNLRFKTHSNYGVILWSGRQSAMDSDDFLLLGIENGYLHLSYNLGSGEINIEFNSTKVSDNLWHRVRAIRNLQEGSLEVDGRKSVVQRSPGKLKQLNTDTGLYVGGMPDVIHYTRRRYFTGIVGCISEIVLASELKLSLDPTRLGTAHNVELGIL